MDVRKLYDDEKRRRGLFIRITTVLLIVCSVAALSIGSVLVSFPEVLQTIGHRLLPGLVEAPGAWQDAVVINIYAPRIILAIVTGASLGVAGAVMQNTLRNPLVSPFTLGLSSAAGFGAALTIVVGPALPGGFYNGIIGASFMTFSVSDVMMMLMAFAFCMLSIFSVLALGRKQGLSKSVMILSGVIIGYLFQAGVTALKYISDDASLREITEWLMGGMWGATWKTVVVVAPIVLICTASMMEKSQAFNAMSSGDDVARTLGVDVDRFRRRSLITVSFSTSACIAFTGIIGFIGLMSPHICRMIMGNDQRFLIPASALMGALILLISDTAARTVLSPVEIPVGVIMYVLGGIFFVYLITRGQGRGME